MQEGVAIAFIAFAISFIAVAVLAKSLSVVQELFSAKLMSPHCLTYNQKDYMYISNKTHEYILIY